MLRKHNLCPGIKYVFDLKKKNVLVSEQQNLFPQHVSRAAKLGNICVRNNVSATMFPSLTRPLNIGSVYEHHNKIY